MNELIKEKKYLYDKLITAIDGKNEQELKYLLDVIKIRFGSAGNERLKALEFFLQQLIDIIFPT